VDLEVSRRRTGAWGRAGLQRRACGGALGGALEAGADGRALELAARARGTRSGRLAARRSRRCVPDAQIDAPPPATGLDAWPPGWMGNWE
jgi:hypothetical protein